MNKNESKYFNTAILMDEALIELLDKKDIEYITIKEICKKAGVNRSTFYLHYENINDLVEETVEYTNKEFMKYFEDEPQNMISKISSLSLEELDFVQVKYLIPYLNFIENNKTIFKASFSNSTGMKSTEKYRNMERYIFKPILEKMKILENERNYILNFYIQGIMAIIKEWVNNGCKESRNEICKIIIKCVKAKY